MKIKASKLCDRYKRQLFTGPTYKSFFSFMTISNFYRSFCPNKTTFTKCCLIQWISKLSGKRWNPLSKFHGSGGHSKPNCLQDRTSFSKDTSMANCPSFNTAHYHLSIWSERLWRCKCHYIDVIMTTVASQITSLAVVYSIVYSDADERKHQSSASLAFVRGLHRDRWIPRTKGQ